MQGFIEAYKKKFNRAPNVFAALGYDAGKMLVDALKRAGSEDTEKIRQALEETKNLKVGTGTISMDKNHNPIKTAVILEMKNGEKELKAKMAIFASPTMTGWPWVRSRRSRHCSTILSDCQVSSKRMRNRP